MTKWLHQAKKSRKLLLALVVAGLIMVPAGVATYAQTGTETEPTTGEVPGDSLTDPKIVMNEEPEVTLVNEETPVVTETQNEEQTPIVDPGETTTAITLEQAQAIAAAEHPDSTIVSVKLKTMNGVSVYKFMFADNWKVYVSADNGTVLKVKDPSDKEHSCQNKYKKQHSAEFRKDWRNKSDSNRHHDKDMNRGHFTSHHRR